MGFRSPPEVTAAGIQTGVKKAKLSPDKAVVAGFLAGAYVAFGGMVAIAVSSGLDPETWGPVDLLHRRGVRARADPRRRCGLRASWPSSRSASTT